MAKVGDGLGALFRSGGQRPVNRSQEGRGEARECALGKRLVLVVEQSAHRGRRGAAGDHPVHGGGQGIDVGPWPLLHVGQFGILLDRGVAWLEDDRECLGHVTDDPPRGAEVKEQGAPAAFQQDDVVGGNVPVKALLPVKESNGIAQRGQDVDQPGFADGGAVCLNTVLQGLPFI